MNFEQSKRKVSRCFAFWITLLALAVGVSYFNFQFANKSGSLYGEILHYSSYTLQDGVAMLMIKQYGLLLTVLRHRCQHLNNLLRWMIKFRFRRMSQIVWNLIFSEYFLWNLVEIFTMEQKTFFGQPRWNSIENNFIEICWSEMFRQKNWAIVWAAMQSGRKR